MSTLAIAQARAPGSASRTHLIGLGLAAAWILIVFMRDAVGMASIWWSSATFNHCLLIVPLIAWLVAQRRRELSRLVPAAWWPGLILVGAGAIAWLLGEAGAVAFARHLGLVLMLQGAVVASLGKAVARGVAFPLFYALFLVPAGEELVPAMQTLTAQITAFLLGLSGVSAHLEGIFITTSTGYFQVAEACAGIRFLIAMAAFGALVANVCFRSWPRRIAFMAVSILVPILANGVRAWGTIYVAHRTGSIDFAASFDHVIYGGIFFAVVIALILGIGWRFFDRGVDEPWFDPERLQPDVPRGARLNHVAAAILLTAAAPAAWAHIVTAAGTKSVPADIVMPDVPGWRRVPTGQGRAWQPHFRGADLVRLAHYRDREGKAVDFAIIVFASQSEGRELVGFGQGAVAPEGAWAWTADAAAPPGGRAERIASHGLERDVVSFYRVGNIVTGSQLGVKLETLKVRLLGGPQRAVAILASSESRAAVDAFLAGLGPIDRLADRAAGLE
jgi:exosortase A